MRPHAVTPIAMTMGEPGGIAEEITIKTWQALHQDKESPVFFIVDDPTRFTRSNIPVKIITKPAEAKTVFTAALPILPLGETVKAIPGIASPQTARAVIKSIKKTVALCAKNEACAVVTNPIQKKALADIGFNFPGHTEYLADLTKTMSFSPRTRGPVMMLAGPDLRTIPITVHHALKDAITLLDPNSIAQKIRIAHESLKEEFGIDNPRIAVAGLNPHSGESGLFGNEEIDIIAPVIERLRNEGLDLQGPHPADTMFHEEARARYDVALCMYHDQALIPVKTLDFHKTVNVTLGLPIIRTSPDHGCALDIAGKNCARPDSLIAALYLAKKMADQKQKKSL